MDIIKTPTDIQFSKVLGPLELIDELGNKREGVLVFYCDVVKSSVVLYKSEGTIFLFDEEDR